MSFSLDPHPSVKRPFDNADDANTRSTQPLNGTYDWLTDLPPAAQPKVTIPLTTPVSSTKQPVVIPAAGKRRRKDTTKREHRQRSKRPLALFGVLFGSIIILTIVASFVAPLGNGQRSQSLAQTVNNWFSSGSGQTNALDPAQHVDPPTPTPALLTGEGYCGGSDIWGTCATAVTASGVMGTGQMQRPIQGATITQYFGHPEYQQWCGCWRPHTGIDLAAAYGTAVTAADSGQVIWAGWDWSGLGWAIKINHGHYIATIYGHLQRFIVKIGENVTKGQVIGYEGSTGASTGPHVHFMVLYNNVWENPVNYVQLP
jgi:murein DD-endopeptidase MepM/ murein hydrolase activator NlpD